MAGIVRFGCDSANPKLEAGLIGLASTICAVGACWMGAGFGREVLEDGCEVFARLFGADSLLLPALDVLLRPFWWVRRCCSMLSFRVKALLHSGQKASFLPVCFLAWRAAWPDVVK